MSVQVATSSQLSFQLANGELVSYWLVEEFQCQTRLRSECGDLDYGPGRMVEK